MTYASHFNPDILITRDNWAVTMICNSKSSKRPAISSGDSHALLVIERVKKTGELFREIIDLRGPGAIEQPKNGVTFLGYPIWAIHNRVGDVAFTKHVENVRYTHKSETWLRSADKVRAMRREAKLERDYPTVYPKPFSIFGNRSILTKDLETFKINDSLIAAFAYCDKGLFLKLFDRVQKCRDGLSPGIERLHERYFNPLEDNDSYACGDHGDGGYNVAKVTTFAVWKSWQGVDDVVNDVVKWFGAEFLGSERCLRWKNNISEERAIEIANLFAYSTSPQNREKLTQSAPDHEKKFFIAVQYRFERQLEVLNAYILSYFKSVQEKIANKYPSLNDRVQEFMSLCEKDPLQACRKIMWLIHEHASLCRITPDSCFTWAREKLEMIDVEIEDVGVEQLLSPTKMYLQKIGDTEHFVYTNNVNKQFIMSIQCKGDDISLEVKLVDSVPDFSRTIFDPILKNFSFDLLSKYDPRFKLFIHLNNEEHRSAEEIFNKHTVFFRNCFQNDIFIQFIIQQDCPEYIHFFDQKKFSFNYKDGNALWLAFTLEADEAFEALLKLPQMDLRVKDTQGRTFVYALLKDSYKRGRARYNQIVKIFCREFKRRYPESYKDFLSQKISIENSCDALDIAISGDNTEIAEFFIEEDVVDYENKLYSLAHAAQFQRRTVQHGVDGKHTRWETTESYEFIMKVFSGSIGKEWPPHIKAEMLHYCCSNLLNDAPNGYGYYAPEWAAKQLIQRRLMLFPKHEMKYRRDKNNGPILIVLTSPHLTWENKLILIQLLLKGDHPDDVNQYNDEREMPLTIAAHHNFDILDVLLKRNEIKVNQQDKVGNTALHCAILAGGKRRVEALITHKNINPNIRNNLGQTSLHLTWDRSIIRSLIQAGADVRIRDNEGRTPRYIHEHQDPRLILRKFLTELGL